MGSRVAIRLPVFKTSSAARALVAPMQLLTFANRKHAHGMLLTWSLLQVTVQPVRAITASWTTAP
jgi:hypothetical protein